MRRCAVPHQHDSFPLAQMCSSKLVNKQLHTIAVQTGQNQPAHSTRPRMHRCVNPQPNASAVRPERVFASRALSRRGAGRVAILNALRPRSKLQRFRRETRRQGRQPWCLVFFELGLLFERRPLLMHGARCLKGKTERPHHAPRACLVQSAVCFLLNPQSDFARRPQSAVRRRQM